MLYVSLRRAVVVLKALEQCSTLRYPSLYILNEQQNVFLQYKVELVRRFRSLDVLIVKAKLNNWSYVWEAFLLLSNNIETSCVSAVY